MNSRYTITCLREGDEDAFRRVFNEYHGKVHAYVLKKTASLYIADEVLQLTFVKLWNYRHTLNEDLPLLSQVFRIARTTMIDLLRKEHVKVRSLEKYDVGAGVSGDISQRLEEHDLQKKVSGLLRQMPQMQKKVFEMSRLEGMSYRDIAASLSISIKTVETHISRALKFLRQHLTLITLLLMLTKK